VDDSDVKNFSIRVKSIPKTQSIFIRNIRNNHLNKFFSIEGYIKARTDVRPQITSTKFECRNCGNILTILQMGKEMRFPGKCSSCGTKGFTILNKELIDGFAMVVEESPDSLEFGTQLRRINVFVKGDLTESRIENKLYQGVKVNIIGVLKETEQTKKTQIDYFLDANYIHILDECIDIRISDKEKNLIESLSKEKGILKKLASEMFSNVYGHDKIKEALILQSFSGVTKELSKSRIRGEIHILLCGDPGCGKSLLLNTMARFQPKVRIAIGGSSSGVGFTGGAIRDEILKCWTIEAGVLPLAHKGLVEIDELDKATDEERNNLHIPMEHGIVRITKIVQATMLSQVSILAAANPKMGKFSNYDSIIEQIDLPITLVNRFDLIFPIKDISSEDGDLKLAKIVVSEENEEEKKEITYDLMKKWILIGKAIEPKVGNSIQNLIAKKYVQIRKKVVSINEEKAFPISARQISSIKRIAQAHARVRLSNEVEKEDIDYSFMLIQYYLAEVGVDLMTGNVDVNVIETGVSTSQRHIFIRILEILEELEDKLGKLIPLDDLREATKKDFKEVSDVRFFEIIQKLKDRGDIFEPKKNIIQRI